MTAFRWAVAEKMGLTLFPHQAEWMLASDGWLLTDQVVPEGEGFRVRLPDETFQWRRLLPRSHGRAHVVAALGSFKTGKSWSAALWAAGLAAVPNARVKLIGIEYDTCAPEFEYIVEFLLSDRGMGMKYDSLQNRPRDGRMWLDLENGARYEARSWERKDGLKGKEDDAYVFCLPLDAPVWMGDYSFKAIGDVAIGDEVIGWARRTPGKTRKKNPATYECDKLCRTTVTQIHRRRAMVVNVIMGSGRVIRCTADHRWLTATGNYDDYITPAVGKKICHIIDRPGEMPDVPDDAWVAGWLAGMYDGEGCRTLISQKDYNNLDVYDAIDKALRLLGFATTREKQGVRWLGGRQSALNFLTWTRSIRYRRQYADEALLCGRFRTADEIVAIEDAGEQEVCCLTTGTGNFVAYGYASHNCEAYQLPGLEAYTDFKQNLDKRHGYAVIPTTPDRPWVEIFHRHGHGDPDFPTWQCICGTERAANPYTFSAEQKERDRKLMTREKFGVHYEGAIGRYVGSVFQYRIGQRHFTPTTHPDCWRDVTQPATLSNFKIPRHWETLGGGDTGTFTSGLLAAITPDGDLLFFYEQPNYRYVGGRHEFESASSISTWKRTMRAAMDASGVRDLWADQNSQWKREMLAEPCSIVLRSATAQLEQRTEVLREYFQQGKVFLAPWLEVLPYELEQAQWPEDTTAGGRYRRLKKQDHTLDGAEHIAARRPRSPIHEETDDRLWIEQFTGQSLRGRTAIDPVMGIH